LPPRIGGLSVIASENLPEAFVIDYCAGEIRLDTSRQEWKWTMMLFEPQL